MKHTIENREQQLETLLSRLLRNHPSKADNPLRLLAFARLYTALYRFVTINNNDERFGARREYTCRAEVLFQVLFSSASSPRNSFTERARLVSALYHLSTEAIPFYDMRRDELAGEALARLMDELSGFTTVDPLSQSIVCRSLSACLYPDLCPDDDWSSYLVDAVAGWAAAQSANGAWAGLSTNAALARIEAMDGYSFLFLDSSYDARIKQAYNYYMYPFPANGSADEAATLYAWAGCYDLSLQGNACPVDREIADAIAIAFYQRSLQTPVGSDEWYYCLASYAVHLCEQITAYYQHEMLQSIA